VTFSYRPASFIIGAVLSAITAFGLLIALVLITWRARAHRLVAGNRALPAGRIRDDRDALDARA
jgi:hypothetical protein